MTMDDFKELLNLPGTAQHQSYLRERLETLSVREGYVLAAAAMAYPIPDTETAVKIIQELDAFDVCFPAGSYAQLGEFSLRQQNCRLPEDVLPYVDFEALGRQYEDKHPGLFVGDCYVGYPTSDILKHSAPAAPGDGDWSVKLKLASPAVPDGVWLRLPNYEGVRADYSNEVKLVLNELQVESLNDCTLLDAKCILPEISDLTKQYDSVAELVYHGDDLGYILDESGQGAAHWREKYAAALEYEGCHSLKFALDISQNLHCYEWVPSEGLADFAADHLRSCGVPDELIRSGSIDLDSYAEDLLETTGYMQASGDTGYLRRNTRQFIYEYSIPDALEMTIQ